jgi:hypothetical protein
LDESQLAQSFHAVAETIRIRILVRWKMQHYITIPL